MSGFIKGLAILVHKTIFIRYRLGRPSVKLQMAERSLKDTKKVAKACLTRK